MTLRLLHQGRTAALPLGAVLMAALLSGCVAPPPRGGMAGGPGYGAGAAQLGLHQVRVDGAPYQVEVRPGQPGKMLSASGSRGVPGQELRVQGLGQTLGMADGARAKKAARAGCAAAGGRMNEAAIGDFDRKGGWNFAGGCP